MIPVGFDYARPESVDGALALLEEHGEDATLLAGGHSLLPVMKLRLAAPELLIDIGRLDELRYSRVDGDQLAIGAGTRHHDLATSVPIADPDVLRDQVPVDDGPGADPANVLDVVPMPFDAVEQT